jgi:hypothetical protein
MNKLSIKMIMVQIIEKSFGA